MSLEIDKSTTNTQNPSDKTIAEAYDATFGKQEHYTNNEISPGEPFETVYLNEEEIEKFMANYMLENPDTEIETRYIEREPVNVPQNIEVRWLRPTTPDIPPIIIQEVNVVEKEEPPIKIIQKRSQTENESAPPIVIREKPNEISIPDLKTIYLPNILKKADTKEKDIKIEHVRSDSQTNFDSRLVYDDQVFDDKKKNSYVDYEEAFETQYEEEEEEEEEEEYKPTFSYKHKRSIKEEQEIQLYEEKLMQTLYEEYLLKLERERLERKLSTSGIFEERIRERERERSISQERSMSQSQRLSSSRFSQTRSSNRFSQSQVRINEEQLLQDEEIKMQRLRDEEFRQHQQRLRDDELLRYSRLSRQREEEMRLQRIIDDNYRQQQSNRILRDRQNSFNLNPNRSSSITNSKVTDENELNRWNQILNGSQNKADAERTLSSILNANTSTEYNTKSNKNESTPQKYNNDYYSMRSSSYEADKNNSFKQNGSNNLMYKPESPSSSYYPSQFEKDDSSRILNDNSIRTDSSLYKPHNDIKLSRSGSGNVRRHKIQTSYSSYYSSNYPNSVSEKNVYVNKYENK